MDEIPGVDEDTGVDEIPGVDGIRVALRWSSIQPLLGRYCRSARAHSMLLNDRTGKPCGCPCPPPSGEGGGEREAGCRPLIREGGEDP